MTNDVFRIRNNSLNHLYSVHIVLVPQHYQGTTMDYHGTTLALTLHYHGTTMALPRHYHGTVPWHYHGN